MDWNGMNSGVVMVADGFAVTPETVMTLNVLLVVLGGAVLVKNLLSKGTKVDMPQPLNVTSQPGSPVVTRKAADDVSLREFTDVKSRVETVHELLEEHRRDSSHKHDDIQQRISALAVSQARMESALNAFMSRKPPTR